MSPKHKPALYALILAGGRGTRFWPRSRQAKPKQFMDLTGGGTLLERTIERIKPVVPASHIYIVTGQRYALLTRKQARKFGVRPGNILLEPVGKNTAPAIAWAAAKVHRKDPQAVLVVLPSDHIIAKPGLFLQKVREAVALAQKGFLVTMGICPSRAETGYGYLKTRSLRKGRSRLIKVEKFIEKPDLTRARAFLKRGCYLWNSGMFIWGCQPILEAYERFLPSVAARIPGLLDPKSFSQTWKALPDISVDYGILEKADNVVTVEAKDIGWSDLGSWEALFDFMKKDKSGNCFKGICAALDVKNTMVLSDKQTVALIGVRDLIVVVTDDAVLICSKEQSQKVKEMVTALAGSGSKRLL